VISLFLMEDETGCCVASSGRYNGDMSRAPTLKAKASILFPMPLPEPFDYAVPEGMELRVGDHVRAPLGKLRREQLE